MANETDVLRQLIVFAQNRWPLQDHHAKRLIAMLDAEPAPEPQLRQKIEMLTSEFAGQMTQQYKDRAHEFGALPWNIACETGAYIRDALCPSESRSAPEPQPRRMKGNPRILNPPSIGNSYDHRFGHDWSEGCDMHPKCEPLDSPAADNVYGMPVEQVRVMEWRTIESAPKDGTEVLLFDPESETGQWVGFWSSGVVEDEPPETLIEGWTWKMMQDDYYLNPVSNTPTHWMPLPDPPADGDRGGE